METNIGLRVWGRERVDTGVAGREASDDPASRGEAVNGFVAGMQDVFITGFVLALLALAIGFSSSGRRTEKSSTTNPDNNIEIT